MDTIDSKNEILNSWKEVAEYLGRGTRTVQRWEHDLGLPVRRPRGKRRSAIMALRPDLDAWVRNCPQVDIRGNGDGTALPVAPLSPASLPLRETILTSRGLRTQTRQLRAEMSLALHSLVTSLQRIQMSCDGNGSQGGSRSKRLKLQEGCRS